MTKDFTPYIITHSVTITHFRIIDTSLSLTSSRQTNTYFIYALYFLTTYSLMSSSLKILCVIFFSRLKYTQVSHIMRLPNCGFEMCFQRKQTISETCVCIETNPYAKF